MPGEKFLCGLAQDEGMAQLVAVLVIVVLLNAVIVLVLVIVIVNEGVEWFPSIWL